MRNVQGVEVAPQGCPNIGRPGQEYQRRNHGPQELYFVGLAVGRHYMNCNLRAPPAVGRGGHGQGQETTTTQY